MLQLLFSEGGRRNRSNPRAVRTLCRGGPGSEIHCVAGDQVACRKLTLQHEHERDVDLNGGG